jgi:hypothetical protein
MVFKTVFDAADHGYSPWPFPIAGLIFVAIGLMLVLAPDAMNRLAPLRMHRRLRTIFSWCVLLFASFWTLVTFASTFSEYQKAVDVLSSGNYSIVEGKVADFHPMPRTGHSMESFTVDGKRFSYADNVVTAGFHNAALHGGPIRDGLYVRIAYVDDLILRLEIGE